MFVMALLSTVKVIVVLTVINPLEQKKCDQFVFFIQWLQSIVQLFSVHVCSAALVTYVCVCIYIYTHTYIHTHIHTYIHTTYRRYA
jgi:hypothetical protein